MKPYTLGIASAILALCAAHAGATEFDGFYAGVNAGSNKSTASGLADKTNTYGGVVAGYNWGFPDFLLGLNGFYDFHGAGYTGQDGGVDVKLGLPLTNWLPYAKLGVAGTSPGARFHGGLGVEYKFAPRWSVNGEWATDKKSSGPISYKNNNFLIGLNYYFGGAEHTAAADTGQADRDAAAREQAARDAAARQQAAQEQAARDAAARQAAEQERMKTAIIERPVRLEGANFAPGSARLLRGANAKLDEVVSTANQYPDIRLSVVGYTDNTGKAASNQKLSEARADAVKRYLVGKGVAGERISAKGLGDADPIADNATAAGRAKNRRVEIHYTLKEEKQVRPTP